MAKFSYLPENKRYKIIHLKEEGYSMRQIAAKVPCGLSTVVRTLKRFTETNFIAEGEGAIRTTKKNIFKSVMPLSYFKLYFIYVKIVIFRSRAVPYVIVMIQCVSVRFWRNLADRVKSTGLVKAINLERQKTVTANWYTTKGLPEILQEVTFRRL
ncbi:hypothetical protein TNCV_185771 [Trichonephila clavipes]|nr:hypothetical protein TNCV_185771 [Trichonephila clavipes]